MQLDLNSISLIHINIRRYIYIFVIVSSLFLIPVHFTCFKLNRFQIAHQFCWSNGFWWWRFCWCCHWYCWYCCYCTTWDLVGTICSTPPLHRLSAYPMSIDKNHLQFNLKFLVNRYYFTRCCCYCFFQYVYLFHASIFR